MSNTKYLDFMVLDERGKIIKETMAAAREYCGFFGFIHGIVLDDRLDNKEKADLINQTIEVFFRFMTKKYEVDLSLYKEYAVENLEKGRTFEALSVMPAKMIEDFSAGLLDAKKFLYMEVRDILVVLKSDIEI